LNKYIFILTKFLFNSFTLQIFDLKIYTRNNTEKLNFYFYFKIK
jgi:hypothetical protein